MTFHRQKFFCLQLLFTRKTNLIIRENRNLRSLSRRKFRIRIWSRRIRAIPSSSEPIWKTLRISFHEKWSKINSTKSKSFWGINWNYSDLEFIRIENLVRIYSDWRLWLNRVRSDWFLPVFHETRYKKFIGLIQNSSETDFEMARNISDSLGLISILILSPGFSSILTEFHVLCRYTRFVGKVSVLTLLEEKKLRWINGDYVFKVLSIRSHNLYPALNYLLIPLPQAVLELNFWDTRKLPRRILFYVLRIVKSLSFNLLSALVTVIDRHCQFRHMARALERPFWSPKVEITYVR